MNRAEAKAALTALRVELDTIDQRIADLLPAYEAGLYTAEAVTKKELELKATRRDMQAEFNEIAALPCCNI